MIPAAKRALAHGVLALLAAACALAQASLPRVAPLRPGATAAVPVGPAAKQKTLPPAPETASPRPARGPTTFLSLRELAVRLGAKFSDDDVARHVTLTGPDGARAELEADSREARINGLRVFLGDPVRMRGGQLCVSSVDAERLLTPLLRPGFGVAIPSAPKLIAIDPGHGGRFAGTENTRLKLQEKDLALDVALRLKKLLEAAGYKTLLTRTTDTELAAERDTDVALRGEIAARAHADLFVSIHFNSLPNDTRTNGTEVYTFSPQFQRSSNSWGNGRDDAEPVASPANRFDHWSAVLAQAMHHHLLAKLKTTDRGKKYNQLGALRRLECPGVLVESAFLSNDAEARRVATPAFRQQIAAALAAAIRDYAATLDSRRP